MLFSLATPESSILQTKATKIRVHLKSGIAEIFADHQDLMGTIENNMVEFETNFDNKVETRKYLVEDGIFVVSTKNKISANFPNPDIETAVYAYGKRIIEINSQTKLLLDQISKEYEQKSNLLLKEEQTIKEEQNIKKSVSYELLKTTSFLLLKQEVEFLKKVILTIKELK
uniref:ATP synthase CF1 epsilon subunit n=1 Tax=Synura sphagnicola TaxID=52556 RepID=A0A3G2QZ58_9STRA|nr:ATP synthase CF1 epsilon subunit [Synura sphagnicola]